MALRGLVSYWNLPVFAALIWLSTLLGLLLHWVVNDHKGRYPSMETDQTIPYISDIGAFGLKPLFIVGGTLTAIFLDAAFIAERYLRHNGRLIPNTNLIEKLFAGLSIALSLLGGLSLILLTILDTYRHDNAHYAFLVIFIVAYLVSAGCICSEYWTLGLTNREHKLLIISFFIKLVFLVVEAILAIAFACLKNDRHRRNAAAVLEWVIAFIFTFYILSFVIDLYPAVRTRHRDNRYRKHEADTESPDHSSPQSHSPDPRDQEMAEVTQ